MLNSLRHRSSLVLAAALALAGASAPVLATQSALVSAAPRPVKVSKRGVFGGVRASTALHGRKSAGISVAQGKRNARKARNVARNRRHH